MTLDTKALLAMADEADAERWLTTQGVWEVENHPYMWVGYSNENAAWIAHAHEREGLLTAAVRELVAMVQNRDAVMKAFDGEEEKLRQQLAEARARIAELTKVKEPPPVAPWKAVAGIRCLKCTREAVQEQDMGNDYGDARRRCTVCGHQWIAEGPDS